MLIEASAEMQGIGDYLNILLQEGWTGESLVNRMAEYAAANKGATDDLRLFAYAAALGIAYQEEPVA